MMTDGSKFHLAVVSMVVGGVFLAWCVLSVFGGHSAAEIERLCGKSGVRQVIDGSFQPAISKPLVVVCKNGRVKESR